MSTLLMLPFTVVSADDRPPGMPLRLEIRRLATKPRSGLLTRFDSMVCLQLRVTNQSGTPLTLDRDQIQLLCENDVCRAIRPSRTPFLLGEPQELPPGESLEGWVAFRVVRPDSEEASLQLTWQHDNTSQTTSLNQVLRDLINARVIHVGFENRIAVLSIGRSVDLMTMWFLDEQFRALKKQGVQRLILDADSEESQRLPANIVSWLQLANGTAVTNRRTVVRGFPAPVQFREFHVTGFQHYNGRPGQIMHRSREQAVAAAAGTLYQRLSTDDALAGFRSPESGIRRAALESSIDRLSAAQLAQLLDSVKSSSTADQQLALELLDRVSNPLGVESLRTTLLSYLRPAPGAAESVASATAAVAARTLVRCIVPRTDAIMREVWSQADDVPALQETLIGEILRTRDHRWTDLASEFAAVQLRRSDDVTPLTDADAGRQSSGTTASDSLPEVLRFLHDNDPAFVDVARRHVLHVTEPRIQDELLRIVIDSGGTSLARRGITGRVTQGAITKLLLGMILRLPDSDWTTRLFELHSSEELPRMRVPTLMAAIRCATDEQLDMIIDHVDHLERTARRQLFQQLMTMNHPRCAELLEKLLNGNENEFSMALNTLPVATSPELLQLVINRYEVFRQAAVEHGRLDGSAFRMATRLLSQLASIDHPEARRMINLSMISPERGLRLEAERQLALSDGRSRTRALEHRKEIYDLRRKGEYARARQRLDELIEQDPFYSEFLMRRASLHLRNGQIEAAQSDAKEAHRLSPGDVFTESTLALLEVRSGQIEAGLSSAESVLKRVPPTVVEFYQGTLYNTACTYSRALEHPDLTDGHRKQYLDRAIELMQQSAATGFHDEKHILNDPDLVMLHDHPEWPGIIDRITSNERTEE